MLRLDEILVIVISEVGRPYTESIPDLGIKSPHPSQELTLQIAICQSHTRSKRADNLNVLH